MRSSMPWADGAQIRDAEAGEGVVGVQGWGCHAGWVVRGASGRVWARKTVCGGIGCSRQTTEAFSFERLPCRLYDDRFAPSSSPSAPAPGIVAGRRRLRMTECGCESCD